MYALLILISYLLGSIPSGLILGKILNKPDLRKQGSGNIGTTNAFRVGGKLLGGLTLLIDVIKGILAVLLPQIFEANFVAFYGFVCIVGHVFPVWLKFKGGKGVATALGVILGIYPILGILLLGLWIAIFKVSRTSSLASLISLTIAILTACILAGHYINSIFLVTSLILIVFRHKNNIIRLYKGEENKIPKDK